MANLIEASHERRFLVLHDNGYSLYAKRYETRAEAMKEARFYVREGDTVSVVEEFAHCDRQKQIGFASDQRATTLDVPS